MAVIFTAQLARNFCKPLQVFCEVLTENFGVLQNILKYFQKITVELTRNSEVFTEVQSAFSTS